MIPAIQWTTPPLHVANSQDTVSPVSEIHQLVIMYIHTHLLQSGDTTWYTTTPVTVADTEGMSARLRQFSRLDMCMCPVVQQVLMRV